MIGDELWYQLWDESQVDATCRNIVHLLQVLESDVRLGEGIKNSKTVVLTTQQKVSDVESTAVHTSHLMSLDSRVCSSVPTMSNVSSCVTVGEIWPLQPSGNAVSGSGAAAVAHLRRQACRCHCQCDDSAVSCFDVETRLDIMQRLYNRENEVVRLQMQLETQRQLQEMEMKMREVELKYTLRGGDERDLELRIRERSSRVNVCWSLLKSSVMAIDAVELQSVLEELGLDDASDLCYCSEDVLGRLSAMLKPVPRTKFSAMLLDQSKAIA